MAGNPRRTVASSQYLSASDSCLPSTCHHPRARRRTRSSLRCKLSPSFARELPRESRSFAVRKRDARGETFRNCESTFLSDREQRTSFARHPCSSLNCMMISRQFRPAFHRDQENVYAVQSKAMQSRRCFSVTKCFTGRDFT